MTRWLRAAKQASGDGKAEAGPVLSVVSVLSEGERSEADNVSGFARQYARDARAAPDPNTDAFPYGTACNLGDAPRTWEGRVVSLATWKRLTEWERHGPNGRLWCGLCQCWHMPGNCEGGEP
jgi:hypothetical protein